MHIILKNLSSDLEDEKVSKDEKRDIAMLGNFLLIEFVCALRRSEIFLVESEGLQKMIFKGRKESRVESQRVVVPLLGRFKNEDGKR